MSAPKVGDSNVREQKYVLRRRKFVNVFCNNSSVHTLNKIKRSTSTIRKFSSILIFIAALAGCLSKVIEFLSNYLSYPVVISLETNEKKITDFPAVTICNVNAILKQYQLCVERKLHYEDCMNLNQTEGKAMHEQNSLTPPYSAKTNHNLVQRKSRPWLKAVTLDYITRIKYGHQAKNFIKSCAINNKVCSYEDFKLSLSYNYGNCFTYIPEKKKMHSLLPGPSSGLELEIDLEVSKYATYMDAVGARIQLHDPRVRHNIDEKSFVVSPGTKTYVAVTKTTISRLEPPYKDSCKDYGDKDSQENCVDACLQIITSRRCFCSLRYNQYDNVSQCDISDPLVLSCIFKNNSDVVCNCPLPCEENVYNTQITSAVWPIKVYDTGKINDCVGTNESKCILNRQRVQETSLILKIFWNTFEYTVYKQKPVFQKSEIFSHIGGLLSLWLGMSVLAIFEALENIILLCKAI